MSEVDPNDDTIRRWAIHHFRFDPERRQRRPVIVVAYDTEREFERELDRLSTQIEAEIAAGTRSNREHVSGVLLEAGYLAAQARGHDVRRAIEHGVDPEPLLRGGPLPSNMAILTAHEEQL